MYVIQHVNITSTPRNTFPEYRLCTYTHTGKDETTGCKLLCTRDGRALFKLYVDI